MGDSRLFDFAALTLGKTNELAIVNRKLPVKSIKTTRNWVAPLDNIAAWITSNILGKTQDTDKCLLSTGTANPASMKLTLGTSGVAYMDIPSTNLSGNVLTVAYYIHPGISGEESDWTKITSLDIDIYSNSQTTSAYRKRIPIYNAGGVDVEKYHNIGWHFVSITFDRDYTSVGGSFSASAVTRVQINTSNTGNPMVTFAYIAFSNPLSKGGCITIIDNFAGGVYQMAAYAAYKNIRLNLSCVASWVDQPGYATLQMLRECQDMGHFIINHTYDHTSLSTLTADQCLDEYKKSSLWMMQNGFASGASVLSVPGAYFPTIAFDALYPRVDGCFHAWSIPTKKTLWTPYFPATRMIPQTAIDDGAAGIVAATDAATYKAIAVVGYHGSYWTPADGGAAWKTYIDGIAAISNLNHYTLDEVLCGNIL